MNLKWVLLWGVLALARGPLSIEVARCRELVRVVGSDDSLSQPGRKDLMPVLYLFILFLQIQNSERHRSG
jgi:hypothetical protein